MKILVINAGSSSLKYQLMDPTSGEVFAKGLCERIYIGWQADTQGPRHRSEGRARHPHAHAFRSH